jgi:hypothetical protein
MKTLIAILAAAAIASVSTPTASDDLATIKAATPEQAQAYISSYKAK